MTAVTWAVRRRPLPEKRQGQRRTGEEKRRKQRHRRRDAWLSCPVRLKGTGISCACLCAMVVMMLRGAARNLARVETLGGVTYFIASHNRNRARDGYPSGNVDLTGSFKSVFYSLAE